MVPQIPKLSPLPSCWELLDLKYFLSSSDFLWFIFSILFFFEKMKRISFKGFSFSFQKRRRRAIYMYVEERKIT